MKMKITFLGTGEAFSERANTSILIDDRILLDCGPHTLQQIMKFEIPLEQIKLVFISHTHADHIFGLPAFLLASREDKRKEAVEIWGLKGLRDYLGDLLDMAYRKTYEDLGFEIKVREIRGQMKFNGYNFEFARTIHSIPSSAISITKDRKVTYTGDGKYSREVVDLAGNSDLLISEAYMGGLDTHSSIIDAAELARESNSKGLALVHICRKENLEKIDDAKKIFEAITVPEDLGTIEV